MHEKLCKRVCLLYEREDDLCPRQRNCEFTCFPKVNTNMTETFLLQQAITELPAQPAAQHHTAACSACSTPQSCLRGLQQTITELHARPVADHHRAAGAACSRPSQSGMKQTITERPAADHHRVACSRPSQSGMQQTITERPAADHDRAACRSVFVGLYDDVCLDLYMVCLDAVYGVRKQLVIFNENACVFEFFIFIFLNWHMFVNYMFE